MVLCADLPKPDVGEVVPRSNRCHRLGPDELVEVSPAEPHFPTATPPPLIRRAGPALFEIIFFPLRLRCPPDPESDTEAVSAKPPHAVYWSTRSSCGCCASLRACVTLSNVGLLYARALTGPCTWCVSRDAATLVESTSG